jgi:uronate dehydrogenase
MRLTLTGAAGRLGGFLRPALLKAGHALRCCDLRRPPTPDERETWITGDLCDPGVADQALAGVEVVVHLAGSSSEQPLPQILANGHQATFEVFEAARRHGVRRVVYASSNHAFGLHPVTRRLRLNDAYRPDGLYGLSKVWGETLGRVYWEKHGIECVALRIGTCLGLAPRSRRELATWLGTEDLARLVLRGVEAVGVGFAPVWGVSANDRAWVDLREGNAIGYVPVQNAEEFAATALANSGDPDPIADRYQGGRFAAFDYTPDEQRPGI